MFRPSCFDRIPACDGQTDKTCNSIVRAMHIESRGKSFLTTLLLVGRYLSTLLLTQFSVLADAT